ncbi:hypothetical protein [Actinomadura sp. NTSP31]|uniref:hypothetical protein n=1 Tax=Actinomadura sp. NTSP31 TaxID=1735447 RepID=UPI0035BED6A1
MVKKNTTTTADGAQPAPAAAKAPAPSGAKAPAPSRARTAAPKLGTPRQPGPNRAPSVTIRPPSIVTPAAPAPITVNADAGVQWTWLPADLSWDEEQVVRYVETLLDVAGVESMRDHTGGGGTYPVRFPHPGDYALTAAGVTDEGAHISAPPVTVHVTPAGPPVFNWVSPADGTVVDFGPGGGQVTVELATGPDQYYPLAVGITKDGTTTTQSFTGSRLVTTLVLAPAPLGPRTITVQCADPDGRTSSQTRTIVAHDGTPPAVTIGAFPTDVTVTSLPFLLTLNGTTSGAQSGVTGVSYAVSSGPSGQAQDTAAAGDWSTWQARIPLPTTGRFDFTITATDTRGGTGSASASINLHL